MTIDEKIIEAFEERRLFQSTKGISGDDVLILDVDAVKYLERSEVVPKFIVSEVELDARYDYCLVKNAHKSVILVLQNYLREKIKEMKLIGITGTNGKTTTAYFAHEILEGLGCETTYVGTLGVKYGNKEIQKIEGTTPRAIELLTIINESYKMGIRHVIAEISSHGLAQKRVYGLNFDVVCFTNLSPEHSDYHVSIEKYFEAKYLLFSEHSHDETVAIINYDDEWGRKIDELIESKKVRVDAELVAPLNDLTSLRGSYNYYNLGMAREICLLLNFDKIEVDDCIKQADLIVPGRVEVVPNKLGLTIVIDFAHDHVAIEKVCMEFANEVDLVVVFGAPGLRDKAKRPLMGLAASKFATKIVLTSDDPRDEDARSISEIVAKGIEKGTDWVIINDRKEAIKWACRNCVKGGVVLCLGKGVEATMEYEDRSVPYSEREVVQEVLDEVALEQANG